MGYHYVPKYYLKGFVDSSSKKICVYNKENGDCYKTNIRNVAQETKYYTDEIESFMADKIEVPANNVLKKIREKKP